MPCDGKNSNCQRRRELLAQLKCLISSMERKKPCEWDEPPCPPPTLCPVPPQMNSPACYVPAKPCNSCELRSSIMWRCDCIKRNGLQDSCMLVDCLGRPECMTKLFPICGPGKKALLKLTDLGDEEVALKKFYSADKARESALAAYCRLKCSNPGPKNNCPQPSNCSSQNSPPNCPSSNPPTHYFAPNFPTSNCPFSNSSPPNWSLSNSPSPNFPSVNSPAPNFPSANSPCPNFTSDNSPAPNFPSANSPCPNFPSDNSPYSNHPSPNSLAANCPSFNPPAPKCPAFNPPSRNCPSLPSNCPQYNSPSSNCPAFNPPPRNYPSPPSNYPPASYSQSPDNCPPPYNSLPSNYRVSSWPPPNSSPQPLHPRVQMQSCPQQQSQNQSFFTSPPPCATCVSH